MDAVRYRWSATIALLLLTLAAYIPAINNGFIADDFVLLHNVETVKSNPQYLLESAPDVFRVTSYAAFAALKALFGTDYRAFYVFNIVLHFINVLLLSRVVFELSLSRSTGFVAGALFAVFQAPQEAVMWLAAMNETLMGLFLLSTVLLWMRHRHGWAAVTYSLALLSKESAPVLLLVLPLIPRDSAKQWFRQRYFLLLIPTAAFAAVFFYTASNNFMIRSGTYAPGLHAASVFLRSAHRLFWPWAYVLLAAVWLANRRLPEGRWLAKYLVAIAATLMPYTFLTYANAIPSRQLYLASAILVSMLAAGVTAFGSKRLRIVYVSVFVVFNIGYMWIRKDAEMQERAAPTSALLAELQKYPPQYTVVLNFPYPYPEVLKGAALLVPGWQWDAVDLGQPEVACNDCLILRWDSARRRYARLQSTAQ